MQSWTIGDVRITRVIEVEGPVPATFLLREATPERLEAHARWLRPRFANATGRLLASVHAFVVEPSARRIVVDTCISNDKTRTNPFWNNLHATILEDPARARRPLQTID